MEIFLFFPIHSFSALLFYSFAAKVVNVSMVARVCVLARVSIGISNFPQTDEKHVPCLHIRHTLETSQIYLHLKFHSE